MATDPTPRTLRESEVVSLHRPSGELRVSLADVAVGDVLNYKGVAFTVTTISEREGEATAYPAQVESLGDVEPWVLRLREGDVVVISTKIPLTNDQASALADQVRALLPGFKILVLHSDVKIGHVRPDVGAEARP